MINIEMALFYIIIIFSCLLRLQGIENIALGDEVYSLYIAKNPLFSSIFYDFGNPFFYFLIIKLEYLIFHFNTLGFKLTSLIFNIGAMIGLWYFLKKKFNINIANIALFLSSINLIMIYFSHEIRCYSFCMFLSPLLFYFFFQTIQKRKNVYYFIYALLGIIAINTHYYEAIFLFLNFIFGIFYLKKRKKDILKFILTNSLILLSFMPFFILVSYKGAILDKGFNSWLEDISFPLIKRQVEFIFGGIISFIFSVVFFFITLFKKTKLSKTKLFCLYFFYVIIFTLFLSIILSYIIRPMITERYFCFLIPIFIAYLSIIFASYKNKFYIGLFLIWLVSIQYGTKITDMRPMYKLENKIFDMVENNEHNYVIIRIITKSYLDISKGYENINVTTFHKNELQKNVQNKISEILKNNKNAVIYTTLLKPDKSNPAANYTCFYDKKTDLCLWQIKAKP